jgi:hypothetical protein
MDTLEGSALENRLRSALAERAAHSPVSPDAWDKTAARSRRRFRLIRPAWLPAGLMIPVAAAVTVVAVIFATTTLTGGVAPSSSITPHTGQISTPASNGASASPGPYGSPAAPPGPGNGIYDQAPPITSMIEFKMVFPGQTDWYYFWLGRATRSVPGGSAGTILLCDVVYVGSHSGGGAATVEPHLQPRQVARIFGGIGTMVFGMAAAQVTSVTAQLPDGDQAGQIKPGRGFPDKIWIANTAEHGTTRLVFRDPSGQQVALLTQSMPMLPVQPRSGGITVFSSPGNAMIAYRRAGDEIGFWDTDGNVTGWRSAWTHPLAVLENSHHETQWFGWAPSGVARIGIQVTGGPVVNVPTIAAWPGSGIRLWGPLNEPDDGAFRATKLITYNAAGHVLEQEPLLSILDATDG